MKNFLSNLAKWLQLPMWDYNTYATVLSSYPAVPAEFHSY